MLQMLPTFQQSSLLSGIASLRESAPHASKAFPAWGPLSPWGCEGGTALFPINHQMSSKVLTAPTLWTGSGELEFWALLRNGILANDFTPFFFHLPLGSRDHDKNSHSLGLWRS